MRALLQRVIEASAEADDRVIGRIGRVIVTLVRVAAGDGPEGNRLIAFHLRISRAPA